MIKQVSVERLTAGELKKILQEEAIPDDTEVWVQDATNTHIAVPVKRMTFTEPDDLIINDNGDTAQVLLLEVAQKDR